MICSEGKSGRWYSFGHNHLPSPHRNQGRIDTLRKKCSVCRELEGRSEVDNVIPVHSKFRKICGLKQKKKKNVDNCPDFAFPKKREGQYHLSHWCGRDVNLWLRRGLSCHTSGISIPALLYKRVFCDIPLSLNFLAFQLLQNQDGDSRNVGRITCDGVCDVHPVQDT